MGRDSLGEFEQLVLLATMRLGENAYVVPIIDDIANRTGRDVTHAAVYVALRRLEKRKLVSSRLGGPTPERGGKPKRFFEVAPEAVDQLRESRDALLSMWEGLEATGR
jgi:DNA-binding PadR family transcriptional regulator